MKSSLILGQNLIFRLNPGIFGILNSANEKRIGIAQIVASKIKIFLFAWAYEKVDIKYKGESDSP